MATACIAQPTLQVHGISKPIIARFEVPAEVPDDGRDTAEFPVPRHHKQNVHRSSDIRWEAIAAAPRAGRGRPSSGPSCSR
jgi:hypothetical protein